METRAQGVSETGPRFLDKLGGSDRFFPLVWTLVVLAQLAVIWAFPRIPTQDGPVHVASAMAFRDLGDAGTSYGALFERRIEPFPNWTSHLVLAALTRVLDATVAEKALASLWFLLWPLGAWRLAGALGTDREAVTGVALLMAFGRVFWLGFYNFVLGAALALLVVAWIESRRELKPGRNLLLLVALFLGLFFTHLGAWVLAAALAITLGAVSADRAVRLPRLGIGLAPSAALVALFVARAGVLESAGLRRALRGLTGAGGDPAQGVLAPSLALEWFGAHAGPSMTMTTTALTVATLAVLAVLAVGALTGSSTSSAGAGAAGRRVVLGIGLCASLAFALGPDDVGGHAGYLKARLALVAPVLVVSGLATTSRKTLRSCALVGLLVLNIWNLVAVASFLPGANRDIQEFLAGAEAVGRGRTLVLARQGDPGQAFDYISPNLYCLGTGNAVATNYQAGTSHFPLKYRPGVRKAAREMSNGTRPIWTDVALLWDVAAPRPRGLTRDYVETYRRGRLRVFTRRDEASGARPKEPR